MVNVTINESTENKTWKWTANKYKYYHGN